MTIYDIFVVFTVVQCTQQTIVPLIFFLARSIATKQNMEAWSSMFALDNVCQRPKISISQDGCINAERFVVAILWLREQNATSS